MKKTELVKWLIMALNGVTDKNSRSAWRYAGALEGVMVMDGGIDRNKDLEYGKKDVECSMWKETRDEYYPEVILKRALEYYV